jgi:hypothetical protein
VGGLRRKKRTVGIFFFYGNITTLISFQEERQLC